MALHNNEYYAMVELRRQVKQYVDNIINNSETYKRIQGYIKLANDNSTLIANKIKENNSLCYEGITRVSVSFNMESLLTSAYEVYIGTYKGKDFHRSVNVGVDSFIILLSECGLVDDTEENLSLEE